MSAPRVDRDRSIAQDAQMTGSGQNAGPANPQQPWLAKLLPLLTLLFTGTVSTLIAQHVIDRVRIAHFREGVHTAHAASCLCWLRQMSIPALIFLLSKREAVAARRRHPFHPALQL